MDTLITTILSTRRAHNSKGELDFVAWLRDYLKGLKQEVFTLAEGCIAVDVPGKNKEKGKILFSCHVDTCHTGKESDGTPQKLFYDQGLGHIFLDKSVESGCLGADDGAGIYIMLKMIEAGVCGSYIFHRGEERGTIGSRGVLAKNADQLKKFDACIAFDRPYDNEVIVTQGGQECASVGYGQQLADLLNSQGLQYVVSHKGVLTDSKVYRGVIRECLNIGVGYEMQHTANEYLDWSHLEALTKACIAIPWGELVPKRVIPPAVVTPMHSGGKGGYYGAFDYEAFDREVDRHFPKEPLGKFPPAIPTSTGPLEFYDFTAMTKEDIDAVTADEELTAGILQVLVDLAAERGRSEEYKRLLGLL